MILWEDTYAELSDIDALLVQNEQWQSLSLDEKTALVQGISKLFDSIIRPLGSAETDGQPMKFPRVFSHELAEFYPDDYTTDEQKRRMAVAVSMQIEYELSRAKTGIRNYTLGSQSIVQSDPSSISFKALQPISIYLRKSNADWGI